MPAPIPASVWDDSMSRIVCRQGLFCSWKRYPTGYRRERPHRHTGVEMIYCESGEGTIRIEQTDYPISPGTLIIFPATLPHYPLIKHNYERWNLCILSSYLENGYLCPDRIFWRQVSESIRHRIVRIFDELAVESSEHRVRNTRYIHLLMEQFFILLHDDLAGTEVRQLSPSYRAARKHGEHLFRALSNYIAANLSNDLSINTLSRVFNYTPGHIWRIFRSATGLSPTQFVTLRRLEKACELLTTTDQTIEMISHAVGFGSASYFTRVFKQKIGRTPTQFRAAQRSNLTKL